MAAAGAVQEMADRGWREGASSELRGATRGRATGDGATRRPRRSCARAARRPLHIQWPHAVRARTVCVDSVCVCEDERRVRDLELGLVADSFITQMTEVRKSVAIDRPCLRPAVRRL